MVCEFGIGPGLLHCSCIVNGGIVHVLQVVNRHRSAPSQHNDHPDGANRCKYCLRDVCHIYPNVRDQPRRTLCAVGCNALFGFMFWLLGCFIPGSESSFPPPNQAASAARRILLSFDPNVTVQARPTALLYTIVARKGHCHAITCGS